MRQRSSAIGEQIRREDGVGTTVDLFMSFMRSGASLIPRTEGPRIHLQS
jgi:hypothetical protein